MSNEKCVILCYSWVGKPLRNSLSVFGFSITISSFTYVFKIAQSKKDYAVFYALVPGGPVAGSHALTTVAWL